MSTGITSVPQVRDFLLTLIDDAIARCELIPRLCEDCQNEGGECRAHSKDPAKVRAYMDLYGQIQVAESGVQLESALIAAAALGGAA